MIGNTYSCFETFMSYLQDYFPEYKMVEEVEYVKGIHKYTWYKTIIIIYFNEYYLIDLDVTGNGGWLSYDEVTVSSIHKVKRHVENKVVEETNWEIA